VDIISKEKIRSFIKKVNKEKKTTFILTTHDLDDIENLCEKVVVINKGKIVFDGTLPALKKDILDIKIIDVTLSSSASIETGVFGKGIRATKEGMSLKLEVDLKQNKIQAVMDQILKLKNIKDINVANPDIESVIKKIYEV
ncbi:MAG: ABC transporter, partial [Nanoarchaeota archaeon]|nr:ABC transporter [Nanoarchaeota archaeon]